MHLHDDISRIADMDDISRVDLQGFALADFSVVTREVSAVPVETFVGKDVGSRLPGQAGPNADDLVLRAPKLEKGGVSGDRSH